MRQYRIWILAIPIVLIDLATATNVAHMYLFFERWYAAWLVALAFASLQIGALNLYQRGRDAAVRRFLFYGVGLLLGVTGFCNIAVGFQRSIGSFPATTLAPAFGFGSHAMAFEIVSAWILGLALVAAGLTFWLGFGENLRLTREREQLAEQKLDAAWQAEQVLRGERT